MSVQAQRGVGGIVVHVLNFGARRVSDQCLDTLSLGNILRTHCTGGRDVIK